MPLDPSKIRARRESLGLSQSQAAERAGMSASYYADLERGRWDAPKLDTVERLARALRTPIAKLLGQRGASYREV